MTSSPTEPAGAARRRPPGGRPPGPAPRARSSAPPAAADRHRRRRRWSSAFSLFAGIWTDKLWFSSLGYGEVFSKLLWTRVLLFAVFGGLMALIVGVNLYLAFRLRPMFRPHSPEQANLERYREVVTPMRRLLLVGVSVVFGIFAGVSATGQVAHLPAVEQPRGLRQGRPLLPQGHRLLRLQPAVAALPGRLPMTAVFTALLLAAVVHYLYGGIRLQSATDRVSGAAQAQLSALFGVFLLLKGVDYWLDRFDLTSQTGGLVTGMTYTRDNAVLPSKNILMFIAVICAVLFFANIVRRTWLLPGRRAGAVRDLGRAARRRLAGPDAAVPGQARRAGQGGVVHREEHPGDPLRVRPRRHHGQRVRRADPALADPAAAPTRRRCPASGWSTRSWSPTPSSSCSRCAATTACPQVLDVDRYPVDGQERDVVVAARELNLEGLPDAQKKWANENTVYTHGYGLIAAYGNQRNADDQPVQQRRRAGVGRGGPAPARVADQRPPGDDGYRPQIYFGEQQPDVLDRRQGRPGGKDVELDVPQGSGTPGQSKTNTYDGKDGVGVGNIFRKLLYAVKFGDANIVLSSRVNENSKILYDRSPRERVQKVAPWLTVDSDALPAVVDGKIVWILDGYTTSDKYPLAEKKSLQEMTSDAINPRSAYATLPTDHINYMRNAVKATVDAYDGTVTLYEWDTNDPILKTWKKAFPGVVKKKSDIPDGHARAHALPRGPVQGAARHARRLPRARPEDVLRGQRQVGRPAGPGRPRPASSRPTGSRSRPRPARTRSSR